jgi:hypothetical protein
MYFKFEIPKLGDICIVQTHTPINALSQKAGLTWYASPKIPKVLIWYIVGNWISQAIPDIEIWENKIMAQKPVLIKEDGPVMALRRWLKQFYSESKVYEKVAQGKTSLEW